MINIFVDGVQQRNEDYLIIDLRAMSAKELAAVSAYNEMGDILGQPDDDVSIALHNGLDNVDWYVLFENDTDQFEWGPFELDYARTLANAIIVNYPTNVKIEGR